jgi:Flp pilus assembly protein TadB
MREVAIATIDFTTTVEQPFLIALLASSLCAIGLTFLNDQPSHLIGRNQKPRIRPIPSLFVAHRQEIVSAAISGSAATVLVLLWTNSLIITLPFSFFSIVIAWVYVRNKAARGETAMMQVWPEVIDHLISGIHSGLSLSEAMVGLGKRGPEILRP